MIIKALAPLTEFGTNCYFVISEQGNAAVIDAPGEADYILSEADKSGITIKKLLLTHGHCDHIGAAAEIQEATGCEVYIHEADKAKLCDSVGNLTGFFGLDGIPSPENVITVSEGDIIEVDEIKFKVMHTPGHTSGSVCYIAENVMFSGDTLFRQSIGRTDMPDGNYTVLVQSLKRLCELEEDHEVYPGHMEKTRLYSEKRSNPFLRF